MNRPLPSTPKEWHDEIRLAIKDARATKLFGRLVGQRIWTYKPTSMPKTWP
jgi:hypothetical protein